MEEGTSPSLKKSSSKGAPSSVTYQSKVASAKPRGGSQQPRVRRGQGAHQARLPHPRGRIQLVPSYLPGWAACAVRLDAFDRKTWPPKLAGDVRSASWHSSWAAGGNTSSTLRGPIRRDLLSPHPPGFTCVKQAHREAEIHMPHHSGRSGGLLYLSLFCFFLSLSL